MNQVQAIPRRSIHPAAAETLCLLVRLAVGAVLVMAGWAKAFNATELLQTIYQMDLPYLGVESSLAPVVAGHLGWVEMALGTFLIAGIGLRGTALIVGLLFLFFAAVIGHLIYWGRLIDCGCLGPLISTRAGWLHLYLDGLAALGSLAVAFRRRHWMTLWACWGRCFPAKSGPGSAGAPVQPG